MTGREVSSNHYILNKIKKYFDGLYSWNIEIVYCNKFVVINHTKKKKITKTLIFNLTPFVFFLSYNRKYRDLKIFQQIYHNILKLFIQFLYIP